MTRRYSASKVLRSARKSSTADSLEAICASSAVSSLCLSRYSSSSGERIGGGRWAINSLHVLEGLLVFQTDLVDQVSVDHDFLLQGDRPRLSVSLGIIDRDLDLKVSEVRTPDLLTYFRRFGQHTSIPVNPGVVAKSDRVYYQGIAGPF